MELLEERIRRDGVVKAGGVLKVDAFLNHQMDIELFSQMAEEWKRLFAGKPINKILTIEARHRHRRRGGASFRRARGVREEDPVHQPGWHDVFHAHPVLHPQPHLRRHRLHPFSRARRPCAHHRRLPRQRLRPTRPARDLRECRGHCEGIGIAIEKGFQPGGDELREAGYDLQSLAIVEAMDPATGAIEFRS